MKREMDDPTRNDWFRRLHDRGETYPEETSAEETASRFETSFNSLTIAFARSCHKRDHKILTQITTTEGNQK